MDNPTIAAAIICGPNHYESGKRLLAQLSAFNQVIIGDTTPNRMFKEYATKGKPYEYVEIKWRPTPFNKKGEMIYDKDSWGFAYARNETLKRVKTTHFIWLDCDDLIGMMRPGEKEFIASPEQAYRAFKKIAEEAPEEIDVWFMDYVYSRDASNKPNVIHTRERMLKTDAGWRFVYPIHEVLVPSRQPHHAEIKDVQAIHYPVTEPGSSGERNMKMMLDWHRQLVELDDRADLQRCSLVIGQGFWGMEKYKECAEWLVKEFIAKYPEVLDIEKWEAWTFVAKAQIELGNIEAAKAAALACIDIEPGLQDGYLHLAQAKLMNDEDPQDILTIVENGARQDEPPSQLIRNPHEYRFTPFCITSECKFKLGQYDEALKYALLAQKDNPKDPRAEGLRLKAADAVRRRDAAEAAKALYQLLQDYEENEKASKLFELLPYVAQENDSILELANDAHSRVKHLWDAKEYEKLYLETEHLTPTPEEYILNERPPGFERYQYVLGRLKKALPKGGRILDVGCFPAGTKIAGTFKTIDQLEVGDHVADQFGNSQKVVNTFVRNYEGALYSFKAQGVPADIWMTSEHPVRIAKIRQGAARKRFIENIVFKSANEVERGDYLEFPRYQAVQDLTISLAIGTNRWNHVKSEIKVNKDVAWLLGMWVAEGTVEIKPQHNVVSFHLDSEEDDLADRLLRIGQEQFGLNGWINKRPDGRRSQEVMFANKSLALWLVSMFGKYALKKRIPDTIVALPHDILRSFIEGWLAGDGNLNRDSRHNGGTLRINTSSYDLMWGAIHILVKLGIVPRLYRQEACERVIRGRNTFASEKYTIGWSRQCWEGERTQNNKHSWSEGFVTDSAIYLKIRDIRVREDQVLQVFNMETEDNTYSVPFVVHNCADSFHSLLYAKHGYEVVGVDINQKAIDLANERAKKWNLPFIGIQGMFEKYDATKMVDPFDEKRRWYHNFDAVISEEVIEHVQEPNYFLDCLGDCAKDGAPIILTTPDESYEKGETIVGMVEKDGLAGHVRVYTQKTFEALLKSNAEYDVIESHFLPQVDAYREHQGWQVGELRRQARMDGPIVRVYCGPLIQTFSPDSLKTGIGGSETWAIHMANWWHKMGCQVVIYNDECGVWDGVFYRPAEHLNTQEHYSDIFVSWRNPQVFDKGRPNAKTTVLMCHDMNYFYPIPDKWVDCIDKIAVLSDWHEKWIVEQHPNFAGKTWKTVNGIDPTRYIVPGEKVKNRYFYSSSPDRGLRELLDMWPSIREAIPDVELHVCYGFKLAYEINKHLKRPEEIRKLAKIERDLKELEPLGVITHDRIGHDELAKLQMTCEAWLYPIQNGYSFQETFCITGLEAMAAKCKIISRSNAALSETLGKHIEWTEDLDIVETLKNLDNLWNPEWTEFNYNKAMNMNWQRAALQWLRDLSPKEENHKDDLVGVKR